MMTTVTILGGTGHLGMALRASAPSWADISHTHFRNAEDGSIPFSLEEPAIPASDIVIGSFPLARTLKDVGEALLEQTVRDYLSALGGARLIQLSSDAVFSGDSAQAYTEKNVSDATNAYGMAQRQVENLIMNEKPDALIVRTSFIFGFVKDRADKRLAPFVSGTRNPADQSWPNNIYRSPTEVNSLARAIWSMAERQTVGLAHIAGPKMSIADFFCTALREVISFDAPGGFEETREDIARNTALETARGDEIPRIETGDMWECYKKSIPKAN